MAIDDMDISKTLKAMTLTDKVKLVIGERFSDELKEFAYNYPYNKSIILDYDILDVGFDIGEFLGDKPESVIKIFKKQISKMAPVNTKIPKDDLNVRFDNYSGNKLSSINELKSNYIGKFVNFEGLVKRRHTVRPIVKIMMFECRSCMRLHEVEQKTEMVVEPPLCQDCGGRSFRPLLDESEFKDKQVMVVQEPLEKTKGTEIPRTIEIFVEDDLVDTILPGQNINITGVLKVLKEEKGFKFYVESNYIKNMGKNYDDIEITPEDKEEILALSNNPDIMYMMTHSVVPSIKGYINEKKAIVLHLFGGTEKIFSDGGRKRPSINILMIGDPGTGKSEMLTRVNRITPNSIMTSGKSSSGAGLTAAAVKDEYGGWSLEAGAFVMADRGHICIDEFDKMRSEDRSALHEVLEQQTLSVNKAGINATLNTRCAVFAAANPKYSKYDRSKSIGEQINMPPSLLSRFDIIFAIEDEIDKKKDRAIGEYILDMHETSNLKYDISPDLLCKYIAYAQQNIHPKVTGNIKNIILDYYVEIRDMVKTSDEPVPITTRQLEGMIRLTEASAKLHLREIATEEDAQIAIDIMNDYLMKVGYDPETGKMDIQKLYGDKPKSYYDKLRVAKDLLKDHYEMYGKYKHDLFIEDIMLRCHVFEEDAERIAKRVTKDKA